MYSQEQGKQLLKLARQAIESSLVHVSFEKSDYSTFDTKKGVFVTLKKNGCLRGCIGIPYPVKPLNKAIIDAARSAAFDDPRFTPLRKEELACLVIEVSVLTVPEEIVVSVSEEYIRKMNIGSDGLIIQSLHGSGLLLPQVFVENNCTPESALSMLCEKAGLPIDAWKNSETKIYKFQAQIFSEE